MKLSERMAKGESWILEDVIQLEEENAALKRESEELRHSRDRWHRRWGIAFDILDTTQRRQYDEEEKQE